VRLDAPSLRRLLAPGGQALLSFELPRSRRAGGPTGPPVYVYRAPSAGEVPRGT
jgi:hypothetical protein